MKFYVGEKEYIVDREKMQRHMISSDTCEAVVYKVHDSVFKFYKEICFKYRLDEISIIKLSKIPTRRILLPKEVIYDENHELFGYTMKYIRPGYKEEMYDQPVEKLLKELRIIKHDLLLLKENNVFVDDLLNDNYIYNKGIYFIDPGSFEINKERSKDYIEIINRELMNEFIMKNIMFRNCDNYEEIKSDLLKHFPLNKYLYNTIKKDNVDINESVYQYTNRIINNL